MRVDPQRGLLGPKQIQLDHVIATVRHPGLCRQRLQPERGDSRRDGGTEAEVEEAGRRDGGTEAESRRLAPGQELILPESK